jgi:ADP-heptose:LPS heptosyltransferase
MNTMQPESVLVHVGLDRVGDGLLKLPFVRGLRRAFPSARITWLAGKETSVYAKVLAPYVQGLLDEVIENAGIGKEPAELLRPAPLKDRRFDLVIDTQRIVWTSLSVRRIRHRTFLSPALRFLLSARRPARGYVSPPSMQRQMLDLLELASGLSFPTPANLDLPSDPAAQADAVRLLPEGEAYLGLAPGSGGLPKCWPLERFVALAKLQVARGRKPVMILGPAEKEWLPELRQALPQALFPLQDEGIEARYGFAPAFTMALANRLSAAVANDSGVGHMLAVGGTPLISLFGPTVPEKFMPMTRNLRIVRASEHGGREMHRIPLERVADELEMALA